MKRKINKFENKKKIMKIREQGFETIPKTPKEQERVGDPE